MARDSETKRSSTDTSDTTQEQQSEEQLWKEFDRKFELLCQRKDLPEKVRQILARGQKCRQ